MLVGEFARDLPACSAVAPAKAGTHNQRALVQVG
jgi:hypothetical protein